MKHFRKQLLSLLLIAVATVSMSAQEFDRGIEKTTFVPKGYKFAGGTISYTGMSGDNYKFLSFEDIAGDGYNTAISLFGGYFIKDDVAVGGRFAYNRTKIKIDNLKLDSDDITVDVHDYNSISHTYMFSGFIRQYTSIGKSRKYGMFNELRVSLGGGQSKTLDNSDDLNKGTYQGIFKFELGFCPGMTIFFTNNVALETSINLLGFTYTRYSQTHNQVEKGHFSSTSANFKLNLLSGNLGITFFIPGKAAPAKKSK